jgi:hypothetical protein
MAKAFKVKFKRGISNVVPSGLEVQVVSNSSKPTESQIKKALEDAGYKVGGNSIFGAYTVEG